MPLTVVMISPGYPGEMPLFTRGLKSVGARVIGLGDQPDSALAQLARDSLAGYIQVPSLWDEAKVVELVVQALKGQTVGRVECLWEPGMMLAARLRQALGSEGLTPDETLRFRDKELMKQALDAAGIRTPRHRRAASVGEAREAAQAIGYPLIIKPIAGAGSQNTHRVDDEAGLARVLPELRQVPEVSVEEFIEGEEYTFDTICAGGEILYYNICTYRPRPLIARTLEWVSPQTLALRDPDAARLEPGRKLGRAVLQALGFNTGFTHMEWFLRPDGEAVFGEIAARPPGARTVDIMNYASDIDLFAGWAEAVCHGRFSQRVERRYNAAIICKRARGSGRIQRVEGLGPLLAELGPAVVCVDLLVPGSQRRDWKQTLLSDGFLIVRHADLETTMRLADRVGTDLQLYAE